MREVRNMASPEKCLMIANGTDKPQEPKKKGMKGNGDIVEIYIDGTACEGQSVPAGTPCQWTGFDKVTGTFFGKPKNNNKP